MYAYFCSWDFFDLRDVFLPKAYTGNSLRLVDATRSKLGENQFWKSADCQGEKLLLWYIHIAVKYCTFPDLRVCAGGN